MSSTNAEVFRIFIKAPIDKVWDYIVNPEFNQKYAYMVSGDYDLRPGGKYESRSTPQMVEFGAPPVMCDGEVVQVDAPKKLVQTWKAYFTPDTIAEGARTLTWDLEEQNGVTRLTVTHDLQDAPVTAVFVNGSGQGGPMDGDGGGWPFILSDLKAVLETGESMYAGMAG